jgi:hypothetical protein
METAGMCLLVALLAIFGIIWAILRITNGCLTELKYL